MKWIIHYQLLPPDKIIDSDIYCQQLMMLKKAIEKNRPELENRKGVVFYRDNATALIYSHIAKIERAWLGSVDVSSV